MKDSEVNENFRLFEMIGGYTKKSDKNSKSNNKLQLLGVIEEIRINYFTRKTNKWQSLFKNDKWNFYLW